MLDCNCEKLYFFATIENRLFNRLAALASVVVSIFGIPGVSLDISRCANSAPVIFFSPTYYIGNQLILLANTVPNETGWDGGRYSFIIWERAID